MRKRGLAVAILILISTGIYLANGVSADVESISIFIPGENPRFTTNSEPIIVAGIIHNVTVALSEDADNVTIMMYYGVGIPFIKNQTNYYEWNYNNSVWSDVAYDTYIKTGDCARVDNEFYFHVGLTNLPNRYWNFVVYVNGSEERRETVFVEQAIWGPPSISGDNLRINIFPYTSAEVRATDPVMILTNIQNIPYEIEVSYSAIELEPYFTIYNASGTFHPGEQRHLDASFNAPAWSPQQLTVWVTVRTIPEQLVTPEMFTIIQGGEVQFPVILRVARSGYDIIPLGDIFIQYKHVYRPDYDANLSADLIITGSKNAQITVDTKDLELMSLEFEGVSVGSPVDLPLTTTVERQLVVNVHTNVPGVEAFINYTIQSVDGTIYHEFYTQVNVGPGVVPPPGPNPISIFAIIFLIVTVLIAVAFLIHYAKRQRDKSLYIKRSITRKKGAARRKKSLSEEQGDLSDKRKSKPRDSRKNQ